MRHCIHSLKLVLALALCAGAGRLMPGKSAAHSADTLSPQERRGRQIYLKGEDVKTAEGANVEIRAVLVNNEIEMPATTFPCANCHGRRGEGAKEGGVQTPPLTWTALTSPATSSMTGQARAPYTESSLKLAISLGVDPAGRRLHTAMPHYRMTAEQLNSLVAYLKTLGLGKETDPGVGDETVKLGAALPLTGPLAQVGTDIRATLTACFSQINAQGGIYGRRLVLAVEDSGGDLQGTAAATRRLVEQQEVFALVGSFGPKGSETINDFLQGAEVPMIGPATLTPRLPAVQTGYAFYLLPSLDDQARQLLEFAGSGAQRKPFGHALRLAIVYSESEIDPGTLAAVRGQARAQAMELVSEQRFAGGAQSIPTLTESLTAARPDYIIFFGSPDNFAVLARAIERSKCDAGLLASALMIGRAGFNLPAGVASRTFLTYPASLPGHGDYTEFSSVMRQAGLPPAPSTFRVMAFAAAKIFIEAARNSGRQLSRAALVGALEQLRDFKTGVLPPVGFGANRRIGATAGYIVGIDLEQQRYQVVNRSAPFKE